MPSDIEAMAMKRITSFAHRAVTALLALVMLVCTPLAAAGTEEDLADLKRAVELLRAENRALAERLRALEAEPTSRRAAGPSATSPSQPSGSEELVRRLKELELAKTAQEDATRAIIRDSLSKVGSKVNEAASLGGAVEMVAARGRDFSGTRNTSLQLSTAELDFDFKANEWANGKLVLGYVDGSSVRFRSTRGVSTGVDRLTVDKAFVTIGDLQRFPLLLMAGRMSLAFGSSTGVHRSDTLAIDGPLTTEAFEMRRNAIGIGFGLPTPKLTRAAPPVIVPVVRPLVVAPLVAKLGQQLGYEAPPSRVPRPTPVSLPSEPPPFYGSLLFYEDDESSAHRSFVRNVNARLGWRAGGHCGRPYSQLQAADFCPWSLDFNIDHVRSVLDSRFFEQELRRFNGQLPGVRGMATTLKATLGPLLLVAEWNGATKAAAFTDDLGTPRRIKPTAWQASAGWQFDWNPWLDSIGGQGSYVALGYSRSRDLAGVVEVNDDERSRVGSLPRSRWTLTAGEWVAEGLKVQVEYSRITDYAVALGGTGATGHGLQLTLTYAW